MLDDFKFQQILKFEQLINQFALADPNIESNLEEIISFLKDQNETFRDGFEHIKKNERVEK